MDKIVYVAAIITPLMTIPQFYKIWFEAETLGVSLLTWIAYLAVAVIFAAYGYLHKEKPIIIMYVSLAIIEALIVVGLLLY
jgi:MtN3 and saliva related transmembrane protein